MRFYIKTIIFIILGFILLHFTCTKVLAGIACPNGNECGQAGACDHTSCEWRGGGGVSGNCGWNPSCSCDGTHHCTSWCSGSSSCASGWDPGGCPSGDTSCESSHGECYDCTNEGITCHRHTCSWDTGGQDGSCGGSHACEGGTTYCPSTHKIKWDHHVGRGSCSGQAYDTNCHCDPDPACVSPTPSPTPTLSGQCDNCDSTPCQNPQTTCDVCAPGYPKKCVKNIGLWCVPECIPPSPTPTPTLTPIPTLTPTPTPTPTRTPTPTPTRTPTPTHVCG
jgi:hypothetical protein